SVTATDTYPAELTLGTPVPSAGTSYTAGVWDVGTLNNGASATLTLPGTVNAGTAGDVVTNNVTAATGAQSDPTTAGDDLVETFTVLPFLSIDDVTQAETDSGTTTFTFTVSINQAVGYDITFDFDTADDTATTADSDYVAIAGGNGTLTNGTTTTTIDVTVNGDTKIEPDESFFVNLTNVVGASVADAQGIGTISNDDAATVSIAATTNANESGPVNGQFTVTLSATSDTATLVNYSVAGTATADTDYTALTGSVSIPANTLTATIDVTGINVDALVEGTETVEVTLDSTDDANITVATSPANVASIDILDANSATVSIAPTTDANESGPVNGQFTLTLTTASATATLVNYSVAGTATADTDYTALTGSISIPANTLTANIDVTGINVDALVEGTETVEVTLDSTDNAGITVATSPANVASIDILDANTATVSIAATTNANESGPVNGQFTVTLTTASATATLVNYSVAGTATPDTDYTALTGSISIPANTLTATIDVTGINVDALVEGTETVEVTLDSTDNAGITVATSPNDVASIDILDANSATVSIAPTTDANESGPVNGQFTVTLTTASATATLVNYSVAGTATADTDYTALTGSVSIPANTLTATIDVTGINVDALVEGTETVEVTLNSTDNAGITVAASPNDVASIDILDANSATVSIAPTTDANESGPVNGQFTVTLTTASATATLVNYSVAGTATADTDYTALTGSVSIPANTLTATIDVTGINVDALVEGTETVEVTLDSTDNAGITVAASPNDVASIDILDANSATVSIAATTNANESGPVNGQFTVTLTTASATATLVNYSVAGTATADTDYTALTGSVSIPANTLTATIDVTGINVDALVEGTETVEVTLDSTDDANITVAASPNDVASIDILDANSATVSIAPTTNANEAGPVNGQFTLTLTTASATATLVSYSVAGTATADTDYTALTGSVSIPANTLTATIDVTGINVDALVEGTETVEVTLNSTDNAGITVAASPNDVASIDILDANSATVSIAPTTNANEAGPVNGQF
ncbi:MAG: Calx-beta domain-containing protein, partial [Woeseia sp.]